MNNKKILWIIVLLLLISAVSVHAALTDDLLLYYTFDNSTWLNDSLGNSNGTNNGAYADTDFILGDQSVNSSVNDGSDYVEFADSSYWDEYLLSTFTINVWAYVVTTGSGTNCWLIGKDTNPARSWAFGVVCDSSHASYKNFTFQAAGASVNFVGDSVEMDQWTMITLSKDAANTYSLYLNGTFIANASGNAIVNSTAAVRLFRRGSWNDGYTKGKLDELAVWNRTLLPSEVINIWNNGAGLQYPFLPGQSNTTVNFTAIDDFNGTVISNFSIDITWNNGTSQTESTTTGGVYLNLGKLNTSVTANISFYNATNYYNLTLTTQDITANTTNTVSASIYQAVVSMEAREKISNNTINGGTFYIGSKSGNIFNLTSGSHTVNFSRSPYYDLNGSTISVTALTNTTKTVTEVYSAIWNISVYNIINNSIVKNYDINITSLNYTNWTGENTTSATGSYTFNGINGTYQAVIDAPGYVVQTFNFTVNATSGAINFSLYTTNSINFTFYDEETKACLTGYNISVELISDLMSVNYSTTNCTLYADLLTPQVYTIRYDDTNNTYGERFYYFNLSNRTNTAIDLYLLNNGTTGYAAITATVYDNTNFHVEGAIIKALRYYIDTNSYIIVDMGRTNFEGVTTLNLKQNEEFYKFIIEYPMGVTKKITEPTQIYADTLNFQILIGTATGARWYKSTDTIANVTFDESNNWFRLEWNDAENTLSRICLNTNLLTNFRNETVNSTCSTSAAGIMYHPVDNVTGYTYHSQALAYYSDPPAPIAAAYHTFMPTNPLGAIGLFVLFIITVGFMFIGKWNIAVAAVLTPIPALLASIAGVVAIPPYVTVPLQIVGCIIAYIMSTRA